MIEKLIPHKILNSINNYDRIIIGGIITIKNKSGILFLKRSIYEFIPDIWEIPSGGMKKNESMLQTLRREVKEETNLDVIETEKYESAVRYLIKNKHYLQLNFHIRCAGTVKLSNEHSEYIFSSINDFKENLDKFMLKVFNLV